MATLDISISICFLCIFLAGLIRFIYIILKVSDEPLKSYIEKTDHGDFVRFHKEDKSSTVDSTSIEKGDDKMDKERDNQPIMSLISLDLDDPTLDRHMEVIQKRKEVIEKEMIGLSKELLALSLYTRTPHVLVENCRFSVGMSVNDIALQVNFYLKKVRHSESNSFTWKDLVKTSDMGKIAFKDIISKARVATRPKITNRDSHSTDATIANFTITKQWQVSHKDFSLPFIRLVPTARILVNDELSRRESEALDDIAYLESASEMDDQIHYEEDSS